MKNRIEIIDVLNSVYINMQENDIGSVTFKILGSGSEAWYEN